ncbi:hypothetical protein GCM10007916_26520 [Psychromonas marina]|uniref:Integrase DNA-binding domain-containing protein n=1 Tax=Psychromonas marina TaxID=88364 RepID=A0ABQ6E305_9GAMM|nr:integrase arm-type DNA-binding domain-containing protein [Psychromonas marina]GLS91583.1 hypothetical protein GCM10007916_26520 [Psychromonas marina]
MARKIAPLSATEVQQAKAKEKEYNLIDGQSLVLRVKVNESKLWIFNYYRLISRKRANLSLGKFPTVTLANARIKAREAR